MTALIRSGVGSPASELPAEGRLELLQVIDEESDRLNRFIEGLSTSDRTEPCSRSICAAMGSMRSSVPACTAPRR